MDDIEFQMRIEALGIGEVNTVTPYVNGTSLIELARRVELSPATEDREPDRAGAYAGLVVGVAERFDWAHGYLNDHPQSWFGDGDSCLLGCICGDTGCWPLSAKVTTPRGQVIWSRFRTGHRSWDLRALGPFFFRRAQYQAALVAAAR